MNVLPFRDYVVLRPRKDVLRKMTGLELEMDALAIGRAKALSLNGEWNPRQFEIGVQKKVADPDSLAWAEVVRVGPGSPALAECRPRLEPGMVVGYTQNRIAHSLNRGTKGEELLVHEHGLCCAWLPSGELIPLSNWVLTERDPEGAQRALERTLPLTPTELELGVVTNLKQEPGAHAGTKHEKPGSVVRSKVGLVVERVVATGPGRWVTALALGVPRVTWVPTFGAIPGDLVGFLRAASSVRLYAHGRHLSLTPWQEMVCAFEDLEPVKEVDWDNE